MPLIVILDPKDNNLKDLLLSMKSIVVWMRHITLWKFTFDIQKVIEKGNGLNPCRRFGDSGAGRLFPILSLCLLLKQIKGWWEACTIMHEKWLGKRFFYLHCFMWMSCFLKEKEVIAMKTRKCLYDLDRVFWKRNICLWETKN